MPTYTSSTDRRSDVLLPRPEWPPGAATTDLAGDLARRVGAS